MTLTDHSAVTWANPLGVMEAIVFGLWLAWRIGWRIFVNRFAKQRDMRAPDF